MTGALKETEAAERRLSSCPFQDMGLDKWVGGSGEWTLREACWLQYLHWQYMKSDEAVLNGVRCGCRP